MVLRFHKHDVESLAPHNSFLLRGLRWPFYRSKEGCIGHTRYCSFSSNVTRGGVPGSPLHVRVSSDHISQVRKKRKK